MSEALRLAEGFESVDFDNFVWSRLDAAYILRRLAGVEAELQQAREERTALLVNEQNLREELAQLNEMNDQLREQNTAVDAVCAKYEQELAALRASLAEPVAWDVYVAEADNGYLIDDLDDPQYIDDATNHGAVATPLYAIKDTK
jgi:septal ring factor EnvC (AmiA/AmiB activator)